MKETRFMKKMFILLVSFFLSISLQAGRLFENNKMTYTLPREGSSKQLYSKIKPSKKLSEESLALLVSKLDNLAIDPVAGNLYQRVRVCPFNQKKLYREAKKNGGQARRPVNNNLQPKVLFPNPNNN